MGRSDGVEEPVSGTESGTKPSFYLVGAPDTGKAEIAKGLVDEFGASLTLKQENLEKDGYALGLVADYRVELKLALERALEKPSESTLYTHSVLDNLAYFTFALSRYQQGIADEDTVQRTVLAWTTLGLIVSDSFRYDHVFFLKKDFDPEDDYESHELQTILEIILTQYAINYSEIEVDDTTVGKIGETIDGYLGTT